jgi:hypothetical protein
MRNAPKLADFFSNLVSTVQAFSFHLHPDQSLQLPQDIAVHPFEGESILPFILHFCSHLGC